MNYSASREFARAADRDDSLADFRQEFVMPEAHNGRDCVYLCSNSLGLQSRHAIASLNQEVENWARLGVKGHFRARRPWVSYHGYARQGFSYLTGATELEVVAMHSLTVNLHLLMTTFYRPEPGRAKVLIESTAFPSDRFAVQSQIRQRGYDADEMLVEWLPCENNEELIFSDLQDILQQHGSEIALILLPGVQYYNGQVMNMPAICELARAHGCTLGLDLAHAVGNVPLQLHDWSPDFAVWCSYKYLCGGPGAVAGAFVAERHLGSDGSRQLLGWWGHDEASRMQMSAQFSAEPGADLWQLSCPSVFSLAPLLGSLELFQKAGREAMYAKSQSLTAYLAYLLDTRFSGRVGSITPERARGAQISMTVVEPGIEPRAVLNALESLNVIVDWREPNVIRVAPVPLYNTFEDLYEFSERLEAALEIAAGR